MVCEITYRYSIANSRVNLPSLKPFIILCFLGFIIKFFIEFLTYFIYI